MSGSGFLEWVEDEEEEAWAPGLLGTGKGGMSWPRVWGL